ncbi:MAG: thioredoxin family protein [Saprospiraceae bacterium]
MNLSSKVFETKIVKEKQPSVLVFGANWSGNSEMMDSLMERVSKEFEEDINFYKVDIEEQEDISAFLGVFNVPTTIMIKDGEVKEFIKGFLPAGKMRRKIEETYSTTESI